MNDHKEPCKEEILIKNRSSTKSLTARQESDIICAMEEYAAIKTKALEEENEMLKKQDNAKLIEALEAVVNFHPANGIDVLKEYINKVLKENR